MLSEITGVADDRLPLEACKLHLRIGTSFGDDGGHDGLLLRYLRAGLAAIEARIGKALLRRPFRLRLHRWGDAHGQLLPVAPVSEVLEVRIIRADGTPEVIEPARYRLEGDLHRPRLRPVGWLLPGIPVGGVVEIDFAAGFAEDWTEVPADLGQAVLLLAGAYHEGDGSGAGEAAMPFGVMALIERWRDIRGFGGGLR